MYVKLQKINLYVLINKLNQASINQKKWST